MDELLDIGLKQWELVLSALFFGLVIPVILYQELRRAKRDQEEQLEQEESLLPVINKVQKRHNDKYGSRSVELDRDYKHLTKSA